MCNQNPKEVNKIQILSLPPLEMVANLTTRKLRVTKRTTTPDYNIRAKQALFGLFQAKYEDERRSIPF